MNFNNNITPMHHFIRNLLLLLVVLFAFSELRAQSTDQNYPVTAQPFIVAQPTQRLSSYFSSSTALTVNLLLKDLTKNSIQVYLKWSMEGPGVRVSSMDGYIPANLITLDKGTIRRFSGLDLQNDYFRQDLIEEQGLGNSPLRTNLPEGFYTFRVQALEAGTGREVSNIGETYFSITTPLPPIINIPFNGAELTMTEPQRINIQWMPRHYRMPGNITTYDLKVCKVPEGYEPTEALDACVNPVIDDKGNPGTFYPGNTGIGSSLIGALERGARYAARVTVHEFDTDGNEVVFVNEGRSEVNWFRYGKECISPAAFVIKEIGPGRVQLIWDALSGVESYKVLYRKTGDAKWSSQTVSASTATVSDLTVGAYEFTIQSGCTDITPEYSQSFELTGDDSLDDLPLALTDPMQLAVQASGCTAVTPGNLPDYYSNYPQADGVSLPDTAGKLKIPGCALQSSAFSVCSPDHPMIPLPSGGSELTSLKTGDVLGIYDFAVFVTEVSGLGTSVRGSFSGKGLVRLPFMEGTLALAEFNGVKAIRSDDGNGGCVYEAVDFKLLSATQAEVAAAKSKLLNELAQKTDPMAYAGTLAGALASYDALTNSASAASLCPYKTAILQASEEIRKALVDAGGDPSGGVPSGGDNPDPRITDILNDLKTITDQLEAGSPKVDSIAQKYQDLISKLDAFKKDSQTDATDQPEYVIRNVVVSGIDNVSARINWEMSGGVPSGTVTKYVIEYQDTDGAVLQGTVTDPQISLLRLREGMDYTFKILAYNGDKVVANSQGSFTTVKQTVPVPVNLAYTRIDDHTVRVTWDKNALHDTYKLVYTDELGILRTVYPTTNSDTLIGLDPSRFYDYQIVAYNSVKVSSDPANARVSSGLECKLGISVLNAQTSASLTGNKNVLLVTGCLPASGSSGNPMGWSNGTPGTIGANGVITFADGETAEISTGNTLFIGATRALTVNPVKNTFYTAICSMGSGTASKTCTYTVEVKVSSPDCLADFKIAASSLTYQKGKSIILNAQNCTGKLQWSAGYGSDPQITVYPVGDIVITATCTSLDQTCYSNNISLTEQECVKEILVYRTRDRDGNNKTGRSADFIATGCSNGIVWTKEGQADVGSSGSITAAGGWYSLNNMKGKVKVFAQCKGVADCPPAEFQVPDISASCDWKDLSYDNIEFENALKLGASTITLRASTGMIKDLKDSDGKSYISAPASEVKVPVLSEAMIYHGTLSDGCPVAKEIPAGNKFRINWSSILNGTTTVLNGDVYDFSTNKGQYLSLSFVSASTVKSVCKGEITWTNDTDPNFAYKGANLLIQTPPAGQVTYYASCRSINADNTVSVFPSSNNKIIVANSESCLKLTSSPKEINKGESLTLTAMGCATPVTWLLSGNKIGIGNSFVVTPSPDKPSVVTYVAMCDTPVCSEKIDIQVKDCKFKVNAKQTTVKIAEPVLLTASGCSGGQVLWSTGESGEYLTVKPLDVTTYSAKCVLEGKDLCTGSIRIVTEKYSPDKIECPEFELSAAPAMKCSSVTVVPKGCSVGGKILWDNTVTTGGTESYSLVLNAEKTIRATCTTEYGQSVTVEIKLTPTAPDLTVSPQEVYAGYPAVLRATGCFNDQCTEGTYKWERTGSEPLFGSSIKVSLIESKTTFKVTCVETNSSKTIAVSTKAAGDCGDYDAFPKGNAANAEINASWCDTNYPINWFKNYADGAGRKTDEYPAGRNKRKIAVSRPKETDPESGMIDIYTVSCVRTGKEYPCNYPFSVESTYLFNTNNTKSTLSGGGTTEPANTPDPCNELVFMDKGGFDSPRGADYAVLYSDWCPGSKVEWFASGGSKIATLNAPDDIYSLGKVAATTTYTYKCYLTDGTVCEHDYKLEKNTGLRIAAAGDASSTIIEKNCPDKILLSTAMEVYYQHLLCQTSNLYTGDRAAAESFVEDVIASLKAKSAGAGIQYPSDLTAVIDAMVLGDCNKAAQLLAAANGSTIIGNDQFNTVVINPYDDVMDSLVPKNGAYCNAAAPPIADNIAEAVNGRVAAYDYTQLFIAPDGRAVRLPQGAQPKILRFTKDWGVPPAGTLEGFVLNNVTYFAEIFPYSGQFLGYRKVKTPMCEAEYLTSIYAAVGSKAYYFEKFKENGQCGYRLIEGAYKFTPSGDGSVIDIPVPVSGTAVMSWTYATCEEEGPEYLTKEGRLLLAENLKDQGYKSTGITIRECSKTEVHTVSVDGVDKPIADKLIQIQMCWDGTKWNVTHSFKPGALKVPSGYSGTVAEVEQISNQYADQVKVTGVAAYQDDELFYKGTDFLQALVEVKEATLTLCNEAKVPEKYWDDKNAGYGQSPFHAPTLSGIGDGALAELKDIPEMVSFGLQIATEPGKAIQLWQGIKSITPDKVKKMALGAAQAKLDKYAAGGNTMKHEAGMDAVAVAMFVEGIAKEFFTNGKKIAELGDVADELTEIADDSYAKINNGIEEAAGKSISKEVKEKALDGIEIEKYADDIADASARKGKKLTWDEVKTLFKRGNDFNKKAADNLWYQANEVVIEHPSLKYIDGPNKGKPRRFRLDSYNPNGAIVSRKATDLANIRQSTFESYLSELTNKYPVGAKIVNENRGLGETLQGKFILEIPESNRAFSRIAEYIQIAKSKNPSIEIVFRPE